MAYVYKALLPLSLSPATHRFTSGGGYGSYPILTLFAAVTAIWCSALVCTTWLAWTYGFGRHVYAPRWMKAWVRYWVLLVLHAMSVPLLSLLLAAFTCPQGGDGSSGGGAHGGGGWYGSGLSCWGTGHTALAITAGTVLVPTLLSLPLFAAAFVDRSVDPQARRTIVPAAHGTVFSAGLGLKLVLVLISLWPDGILPSGYGVLTAVIGGVWAFLYLRYLPYWHMSVNACQVVAGMAICTAGIATVLGGVVGQSGSQASDVCTLAWLLTLPPVLFSSWTRTKDSFEWYGALGGGNGRESADARSSAGRGRSVAADDSTSHAPFVIELRARYSLQQAITKQRFALGQPHGRDPDDLQAMIVVAARRDAMIAAPDAAAAGASVAAAGQRTTAQHPSAIDGATIAMLNGDYVAEDTVDLSHPALAEVEALYRRSVDRHAGSGRHAANQHGADDEASGSALLHFHYSHFLGRMRHNKHLERMHLKKSERCARGDTTSIGVRFGLWTRRLELAFLELGQHERDVMLDQGHTQQMRVEDRVRFEKLLAMARDHMLCARELLASFWECLSERTPDKQRVKGIGDELMGTMEVGGACVGALGLEISCPLSLTGLMVLHTRHTSFRIVDVTAHPPSHLQQAESSFAELLSLAPANASVMRVYGQFLLEVANQPSRAHRLLADAEAAEDEASRNHAQLGYTGADNHDAVTDRGSSTPGGDTARSPTGASAAGADPVESSLASSAYLFGCRISSFDLSAEGIGFIRISNDAASLGAITHVNGAAQKLFGYPYRCVV